MVVEDEELHVPLSQKISRITIEVLTGYLARWQYARGFVGKVEHREEAAIMARSHWGEHRSYGKRDSARKIAHAQSTFHETQ